MHGLAAAVAAQWLAARFEWSSAWQIGCMGLAVAAVATVLGCFRCPASSPPRELAWTGDCWTLDGRPGAVALRMDLGPWLLLRYQGQAGARDIVWLPVNLSASRRTAAMLRAALLAQAGLPSAFDAGRTLSPHG